MQKTRVRSLGWVEPLEEEMAPHSSTFAWKIPWAQESGGLQLMGPQRVRHNWETEHMHARTHTHTHTQNSLGFPGGSVIKNLPASEGDTGDLGSTLGLRWSPGGRNGNPLHLFLPGKFHGQRSLAGYSPWGCKELDMTEQLSLHAPTGQGADTALKQEQSEFLPKEIGLSWHLDA